MRWSPTPRERPGRCATSGRSSPADGPYLELNELELYIRNGMDANPFRVYLSHEAIKSALLKDGSPLTVVDRTAYEQVLARSEELEQLCTEQEELIAELENRTTVPSAAEIADELESRGKRVSAKPGPKPKPKEAA